MKYNCNLIRDLLPLYQDQVVENSWTERRRPMSLTLDADENGVVQFVKYALEQ